MDTWLKNAIEERISSQDIFVLESDKTIKDLIKETNVIVGKTKSTVSYKDAVGDIIFETEIKNTLPYPKIGIVTTINPRTKYVNNYLKDNIKVVKINLNKKYDTDIIDWVNKQNNTQAAIKKLIRKEIERISNAKNR